MQERAILSPSIDTAAMLSAGGLTGALEVLKRLSMGQRVQEQRRQIESGDLCPWLITWGNSLEYVQKLGLQLDILNFYQRGFPDEWRQSSQSAWRYPNTLHTEREMEFFDLIREEWFPFPEPEDEFIAAIPVYPLGFDYWNYQIDDLSPLYALLCGLDSSWYNWEECLSHVHPTLRCPPPVEQIEWKRLTEACEQLDTPLKHLPDALTLFNFETGNVFLDSTLEYEMDYWKWSWESLCDLCKEMEEATRLQERFTELEEWLLADLNRIRELVELWNRFAPQPRERREPVIKTISSREFVEGIDLRSQMGRYHAPALQPTD